jgi:hypothetical protein
MKKLIATALLIAFAGTPSMTRAAAARPPAATVDEAPGARPPNTSAGYTSSETNAYAAREAAAPELAQFQGGNGVYIGGGLVTVLLIILLIVIIF